MRVSVNFNKFKQAVDFKPAWTVQRRIEQAVQAIRCGLVRDYRDSTYGNVESLIAGDVLGVLESVVRQ